MEQLCSVQCTVHTLAGEILALICYIVYTRSSCTSGPKVLNDFQVAHNVILYRLDNSTKSIRCQIENKFLLPSAAIHLSPFFFVLTAGHQLISIPFTHCMFMKSQSIFRFSFTTLSHPLSNFHSVCIILKNQVKNLPCSQCYIIPTFVCLIVERNGNRKLLS